MPCSGWRAAGRGRRLLWCRRGLAAIQGPMHPAGRGYQIRIRGGFAQRWHGQEPCGFLSVHSCIGRGHEWTVENPHGSQRLKRDERVRRIRRSVPACDHPRPHVRPRGASHHRSWPRFASFRPALPPLAAVRRASPRITPLRPGSLPALRIAPGSPPAPRDPSGLPPAGSPFPDPSAPPPVTPLRSVRATACDTASMYRSPGSWGVATTMAPNDTV